MGAIAIAGSGAGGRTIFTADRTFYVRTTGSDSNSGTLASPFATIQHAANVLASTYDIANFQAFIDIGPGTFVGVQLPSFFGGGIVQFNGAGSSSTIVQLDGITGFGCFDNQNTQESICAINKVKLDSSHTNGYCVYNYGLSFIGVGDASTVNNAIDVYMSIGGFGIGTGAYGGAVYMSPNTTLSQTGSISVDAPGFAFGWLFAEFGAAIILTLPTTTMISTPIFTSATARMSTGGQLIGNSGIPSGAASAGRYSAVFGSNIADNFAGPNWMPGNSPGGTDGTSTYGQSAQRQVLTYTDTDHTLQPNTTSADTFAIIEMHSAAAHNFTIPTNASMSPNFPPVGTRISVVQTGAGAVTIVAAVGVTGNNFGAIGGQWQAVMLYQSSPDVWTQIAGGLI